MSALAGCTLFPARAAELEAAACAARDLRDLVGADTTQEAVTLVARTLGIDPIPYTAAELCERVAGPGWARRAQEVRQGLACRLDPAPAAPAPAVTAADPTCEEQMDVVGRTPGTGNTQESAAMQAALATLLPAVTAELEAAARAARDLRDLTGAQDSPGYVDLDQMAALVHRCKSTLEKLKRRQVNPLPPPDIEGGGGKKGEWLWTKIHPWLEAEFGKLLPRSCPTRLR
jgi:hypothetical protein